MYRIYNQDCFEGMKQLPDKSVDLILTDPPYNVTGCACDCDFDITAFWKEARRLLKPCCAALIFAITKFAIKVALSNFDEYKYDWVWIKDRPTFFVHAKNAPMRLTERILVFSDGAVNHASISKRRMKYNPQGLISVETPLRARQEYVGSQLRPSGKCYNGKRKMGGVFGPRPSHKECCISQYTNYPTEVLNYSAPSNVNRNHPLEKPVALLEYLIKTYSNEGETVLDATMGSGSTGVAAVNTGRNFIGFETDIGYYEIAQKRINEAVMQNEQIETIQTDAI